MLSRIARGLYTLGRYVERAHNVVRILEVNHKMNLERASIDEANVWNAIAESFDTTLTFTIDNSANTFAATALAFVDTLPFDLVVASAPSVVNGCGGTVTAAAGSTTYHWV